MSARLGALQEGGSTYYLFDHFSLEPMNPAPTAPPYALDSVFSLEEIYFDFDPYALNLADSAALVALVNYLAQHDDLVLLIRGNTDETGTEDYNRALSLNRATAVMEALVQLGASRKQLQAKGLGESILVSEEDALNRRTEFVLTRRPIED